MKVALLLLCNLVVAPGLMYGQSPESNPPLELEDAPIPCTLVEPVFQPPALKPAVVLKVPVPKPTLSAEEYEAIQHVLDHLGRRPDRPADKKFWLMTAAMFGASTFESMELRGCRQRISECGGYGGYLANNYGMRFAIAGGAAGFAYLWRRQGDPHSKSWLVWPIGFIVVSVADGIHTGLKQP